MGPGGQGAGLADGQRVDAPDLAGLAADNVGRDGGADLPTTPASLSRILPSTWPRMSTQTLCTISTLGLSVQMRSGVTVTASVQSGLRSTVTVAFRMRPARKFLGVELQKLGTVATEAAVPIDPDRQGER